MRRSSIEDVGWVNQFGGRWRFWSADLDPQPFRRIPKARPLPSTSLLFALGKDTELQNPIPHRIHLMYQSPGTPTRTRRPTTDYTFISEFHSPREFCRRWRNTVLPRHYAQPAHTIQGQSSSEGPVRAH